MITPSAGVALIRLTFPPNLCRPVTFFPIRNLNRTRHDACYPLAEKNNIETSRPATSNSAISPLSCLYRDRAAHRFRPEIPGVPGSCQPRGRKVHEPLSLVVDDRVAGSTNEKKRSKKSRQGVKTRRWRKREKRRRRRRSSIYHPAKWARRTGLETCRLGSVRPGSGSARA